MSMPPHSISKRVVTINTLLFSNANAFKFSKSVNFASAWIMKMLSGWFSALISLFVCSNLSCTSSKYATRNPVGAYARWECWKQEQEAYLNKGIANIRSCFVIWKRGEIVSGIHILNAEHSVIHLKASVPWELVWARFIFWWNMRYHFILHKYAEVIWVYWWYLHALTILMQVPSAIPSTTLDSAFSIIPYLIWK